MKKNIYILFLLFYITLNTKAQWQQIYNNGTVISVTAQDSVVVAGVLGPPVLISTDYGSIWNYSNPCFYCAWNYPVLLILGSNIFAGNIDALFLTSDYGANWDSLYNGIPQYTSFYAIITSGTNIYTGTSRGVYVSSDTGASWTAFNNGLTATVKALAISQTGNLFAGTSCCGIFFYADTANKWVSANTAETDSLDITSIAICGDNIFLASRYNGIYLSTDNGSNWTKVSYGIPGVKFTSLAVSAPYVFTATEDSGIFMTSDTGKSWTAINEGLSTDDKMIYGLAVDSTNIFAASIWSGVWKRPLTEMSNIIEKTANAYFHLYPNPASNHFIVEFKTTTTAHFTIYDLLGKKLQQHELPSDKTVYTISNLKLENGVYFYGVSVEREQVAMGRIVVVR